MAAPDTFYITIHGRGGHAAQPQATVDPIVIAAQVVTNLQHIVSRNIDPLDPVVLSVTQFHAGTAHNIIPETVELNGTVRSFKPELRTEVPRRMEQIIRGITEAHGATYTFRYEQGYRPVVNDDALTEKVKRALVDVFGETAVVEGDPHMGARISPRTSPSSPGRSSTSVPAMWKKALFTPTITPSSPLTRTLCPSG
ncbi:hypothetical protein GCM10025857_27550 [Alicyclobacillus contaminans]|nr:hypothetical protein GCM10025857_27550 [Alicyclobacillus contaminans]